MRQMGWDRADGVGWNKQVGMGWEWEWEGDNGMGQDRQERTDRTCHCPGPLWSQCGCSGGTGHSRDTAQLPNPSKAAQILHGECQDGASSRAQAGNNDRAASGDWQAHASLSQDFSICSQNGDFLPLLFQQPFPRSPAATSCSGWGSHSWAGQGWFGGSGDILSHHGLGDAATAASSPCTVTSSPRCRTGGRCGDMGTQTWGCRDLGTHGNRDGHVDTGMDT